MIIKIDNPFLMEPEPFYTLEQRNAILEESVISGNYRIMVREMTLEEFKKLYPTESR